MNDQHFQESHLEVEGAQSGTVVESKVGSPKNGDPYLPPKASPDKDHKSSNTGPLVESDTSKPDSLVSTTVSSSAGVAKGSTGGNGTGEAASEPSESGRKKSRKGKPKNDEGMDEAERKEFYRKRNAMYSRRKYMRKKIEIEVLQTQKTELFNENRLLRSEGDRLTALLREAKRIVTSHEAGRPLFGASIGSGISSTAMAGVVHRPTPRHANLLGTGSFGSINPSLPSVAQRALLKYQQLKNQGQNQTQASQQGSLSLGSSMGTLQEQLLQQQMQNKILMANLIRQQGGSQSQALDSNLHNSSLPLAQPQGLSSPEQQLQRELELRQLSSQIGLQQQLRASGTGLHHAYGAAAPAAQGSTAASNDISSFLQANNSQASSTLLQQQLQQQALQSGSNLSSLLQQQLLQQQQLPQGSSANSSELVQLLRLQQEQRQREDAERRFS